MLKGANLHGREISKTKFKKVPFKKISQLASKVPSQAQVRRPFNWGKSDIVSLRKQARDRSIYERHNVVLVVYGTSVGVKVGVDGRSNVEDMLYTIHKNVSATHFGILKKHLKSPVSR